MKKIENDPFGIKTAPATNDALTAKEYHDYKIGDVIPTRSGSCEILHVTAEVDYFGDVNYFCKCVFGDRILFLVMTATRLDFLQSLQKDEEGGVNGETCHN